jgi:hypothetical protein
MLWNLPDDWSRYARTCDSGHRYHASEGGCETCRPCAVCTPHRGLRVYEVVVCEGCKEDGWLACSDCGDLAYLGNCDCSEVGYV